MSLFGDKSLLEVLPETSWRVEGAARLVVELSEAAEACRTVDELPQALLATLAARLPLVRGRILAPRAGSWVALAGVGPGDCPGELAGDALDRGTTVSRDGWLAAGFQLPGQEPGVLAGEPTKPPRLASAEHWAVWGRVVSLVWRRGEVHLQQAHRARQLAEVLVLARTWASQRETQPLWHDIAAAATRLLDADRATIFRWDRGQKILIGRPALGVAGDELRVPDDRGVVGRVIRARQPERVDRGHAAEQVDPGVGQRLGYETRTLLCVPLLGTDGQCSGAFQVLNKRQGNFTDEDQTLLVELARHAAVALDNTAERERLVQNQTRLADTAAARVQLVGQSPAIEALRSTIARVAATDLAVLVLGENGTGKEVVSQAIHYQSTRRERPLVAVNCAALSETLLESELFGHEKGAFTDAHEARAGKFELAAGGTLFLDEIGDLSPAGQAKLLRVLEEKVVVRVGGSKTITTDVRVIAATNQPLGELVRQKKFRQDLYYRLSVVTLELPPLRERAEDVGPLAEFFLGEFSRRAGRRPLTLSSGAHQKLTAHRWPGNVRELRNQMERLAYLLPTERIEPSDLVFLDPAGAAALPTPDEGLPLAEATDRFQEEHVRRAVRRAGGNMTAAAELLGLHRSNLYRKMRQLGMATEGFAG